MAENGATAPDLLLAAFALIGDDGWRGFSFETLARRTGVSRVEIYRQFHSRGALRALTERADEAMLEVDEAELAGLPPRDRVFELLMRRLETLVPYRAGLKRLAGAARMRGPADRLPSGALLRLAAGRRRAALPWPARPRGAAGARARLRAHAPGVVRGRGRRSRQDHGRAGQAAASGSAHRGLREPRARRAEEGEAAQPA